MVNINGLPEINGENYPLDIWSLYMQSAVGLYPEQEFDVPSPFMDLQIKTDGRAVPPTETTEDTDESTTGEEPDEDNPLVDEPSETNGERRTLEPSPQSASPAPQSASPAPASAPPAREPAGSRRGSPDGPPGPGVF
jgi:penicillin-binding protein 1A